MKLSSGATWFRQVSTTIFTQCALYVLNSKQRAVLNAASVLQTRRKVGHDSNSLIVWEIFHLHLLMLPHSCPADQERRKNKTHCSLLFIILHYFISWPDFSNLLLSGLAPHLIAAALASEIFVIKIKASICHRLRRRSIWPEMTVLCLFCFRCHTYKSQYSQPSLSSSMAVIFSAKTF